MARRHPPGELGEFETWLADILISIEERLGALMGAQDDIDTAAATVTDATGILTTVTPEIQAEIGSGGVDTSALNASLAPLVAAVQGVQALAGPAGTTPPAGASSGATGAAGAAGTDGGPAAGTDG